MRLPPINRVRERATPIRLTSVGRSWHWEYCIDRGAIYSGPKTTSMSLPAPSAPARTFGCAGPEKHSQLMPIVA